MSKWAAEMTFGDGMGDLKGREDPVSFDVDTASLVIAAVGP